MRRCIGQPGRFQTGRPACKGASLCMISALRIIAFALLLPLPSWSALTELPWYRQSMVGMEVGPTGAQFGDSDATDTRYCARFDGKEIVRRCAEAGAEYVVIWARDGDYAYYDS